ncbi:SdpI family protein [Enterococcus sp. DIV0187]|uniref:SdpI family protein n=1 Tax=Enterococcus sp. DIV0187 TaxID=2774644 RepID=UPI003F25DF8E
MVWLIGLLPSFVFLFVMPILETRFAKEDRFRTNSVYGFRSTKAVRNPTNWKKAQIAAKNSSFVFGAIQLLFTILSKIFLNWSDEMFLIGVAVSFFLLVGLQFFLVNSLLD